MLNQDLLLKLKESGFPQKVFCPHGEDTLCDCQEDFENGKQTEPYRPNLSELIEVCGNGFLSLNKNYKSLIWYVKGTMLDNTNNDLLFQCEGRTPEEAVARLFISLQEKGNEAQRT